MTSEASVEDRFKVTKFRPKTVTGADDHRPLIRIATGNLKEMVDQAETALIASNSSLYQRADRIVSVGETTRVTANKIEVTVIRIYERGEHALLEDLNAAARFEKWDGRSRSFVLVDAPGRVVKTLRERTGRLKFSPLIGVVNAPTLRPDGSLLEAPGYDDETGLLFDPKGVDFPKVFPTPGRGEAEDALHLLRNAIDSFPFVSEADRSVALSGILTACCRRSLRTAPLHGFSAPVAGSGKSMLVDLTSIIATGREAGVIAQGKSEEETEKRLGAMFLAGDQVIAIDNCEAPLGGDFLCQALTQPTVRIRILGRSETPELPTGAFVTATGNNLRLIGDMTRRALLCSLDPKVERPELRKFSGHPIANAKKQRAELVHAALTMLRAYVSAGRPRQADPLGSFEEWSNLVRSTLMWLGCADPVDTIEAARACDPELDTLQSVMSQWDEVVGNERVSVRGVVAKATEKTATLSCENERAAFTKPDFREALLAVAGQGGAINTVRLGRWLSRNENRIIQEIVDTDRATPPKKRHFARCGMVEGFMTWQLVGAGSPAAATQNTYGLIRSR